MEVDDDRVTLSMEFVIPGNNNNVGLLRKNVARIKRLFNVDVQLTNTFQNGNTTMQWVHFVGGQSTSSQMENAKTYTISMTNPSTCVAMDNVSPSLYQASVDEIEAETHAFLSQIGNRVVLQGSQLAVVLAQSMLESMQQDVLVVDGTSRQSDTGREHSARGRDATERKIETDSPQLVSDFHNDFMKSAPSPSHRPSRENPSSQAPSSKANRPPETFFPSPSPSPQKLPPPSSSHVSITDKNIPPPRYSPTPPTSASRDRHRIFTDRNNENRASLELSRNKTVATSSTTKTTTTTTSNVGIDTQYKCLKDLGLAHSYSSEVIEDGLKRCDMTEVVQPNEFLEILQFVSKSKKGSNVPPHSTTVPLKVDLPHVSSSYSSSSAAASASASLPSTKKSSLLSKSSSSPSTSSSSSPRKDNVIVIDSDSEHEGGRTLMDQMEAYVISSDEDQVDGRPFINAKTKKKNKPAAAKVQQHQKGGGAMPGPSSNHRPLPQPTSSSSSLPRLSQQQQPPVWGGNAAAVTAGTAIAATSSSSAAARDGAGLRHIIIDGNNVAMCHGDNKIYSVRGIRLCIDYFLRRGHKVTAFVSGTRRFASMRSHFPIRDHQLLEVLQDEGFVKFTPSRRLTDGKIIASYDDRFVLNLADAEKGIVVSNDQFRDLLFEKPSYRELIETRLLPFMFVGDLFMPPDDPLGRDGPPLDQFLRFGGPGDRNGGGTTTAMAGNVHPAFRTARPMAAVPNGQEKKAFVDSKQQQHKPAATNVDLRNARGLQLRSGGSIPSSTARDLQSRNSGVPFSTPRELQPRYSDVPPSTTRELQPRNSGVPFSNTRELQPKSSAAVPFSNRVVVRSKQKTNEMYTELSLMFPEPEQQERIRVVLQNHPDETDLTRLCNYIINALAL